MKQARFLAALIGAVCSFSTMAHEFWVRPLSYVVETGKSLDVRLFVGDGFPGEVVTRNGPKIVKFAAYGDGAETPITGENGKDPAGSVKLEKAGVYVLAFRNIPSKIELDAAKFEEYLKEEGLDTIIKKRADSGASSTPGKEMYSRSAKAIVRVGDAEKGFDREVGLKYELTPLSEPWKVQPGEQGKDELRFKAVFDSKPLAGIMVAARTPDDPKLVIKATTDEHGIVTLKLPKTGMWLVSSVHMLEAPANSGSDWESVWASVTFEVPATTQESASKK